MLDYLKLQATADDLELRTFGPLKENQVRQCKTKPPARPVPLEQILASSEADYAFLNWLSWDATYEDARRAFVSFHAAVAWAMSESEDAEATEALRILREEPDARALIKIALPTFSSPDS